MEVELLVVVELVEIDWLVVVLLVEVDWVLVELDVLLEVEKYCSNNNLSPVS